MRPLIGIPCHEDFRQHSGRPIYCNNRTYTHALESVGGIAVLIPILNDLTALESLLMRLDGLLFSGGVDVEPGRYNGEPHPQLSEVDLRLDEFELTLAHWALQERSEEHTSELQSRENLVCRLLLEKKNYHNNC